MKSVLFLTNNPVSYPLIDWIAKRHDTVICTMQDRLDVANFMKFEPDIVISYSYKYIISKDIIDHLSSRIINLHISLLPWNRGADPNLWSFLENTPKGVTIHYIDENVDTGDILFQKEVFFNEEKETLDSTYVKLHTVIQKLFRTNWDRIVSGTMQSQAQDQHFGSLHRRSDFEKYRLELLKDEGWNVPIPVLKHRWQQQNKRI